MLYVLLTANLLVTCLVCFLLIRKKKQEKQTLTADANELLAQLLKGGAVAVIRVVDPSAIFLWSPKDRGEP
jgi:hypothetical protein